MKLEKQVVSLEIAKKLKELGVKQESCFRWQCSRTIGSKGRFTWHLDSRSGEFKPDKYSAFTVAELGEMLPAYICLTESAADTMTLTTDKGEGIGWGVWYDHTERAKSMLPQTEKTEADARGKMLIYLLENKLITI